MLPDWQDSDFLLLALDHPALLSGLHQERGPHPHRSWQHLHTSAWFEVLFGNLDHAQTTTVLLTPPKKGVWEDVFGVQCSAPASPGASSTIIKVSRTFPKLDYFQTAVLIMGTLSPAL